MEHRTNPTTIHCLQDTGWICSLCLWQCIGYHIKEIGQSHKGPLTEALLSWLVLVAHDTWCFHVFKIKYLETILQGISCQIGWRFLGTIWEGVTDKNFE